PITNIPTLPTGTHILPIHYPFRQVIYSNPPPPYASDTKQFVAAVFIQRFPFVWLDAIKFEARFTIQEQPDGLPAYITMNRSLERGRVGRSLERSRNRRRVGGV
ncbi:hypothetical protein HDV00_005103, partial [Rhizophlyctis rosea]